MRVSSPSNTRWTRRPDTEAGERPVWVCVCNSLVSLFIGMLRSGGPRKESIRKEALRPTLVCCVWHDGGA